ncbi:hypothetical protein JAAARDRAFT_71275 [Jaapia argillacea MUCL 33604]|uniref:Uncharacterized protein n=1 Tax=Jaapia argillacea MUCL 33604 TaxID=933084 RepID=A0A067PNL4_9AGAM|nr:hypothetical protein JAAARDRAFT_71275 [Jaapia argillacea MUCL 33604]
MNPASDSERSPLVPLGESSEPDSRGEGEKSYEKSQKDGLILESDVAHLNPDRSRPTKVKLTWIACLVLHTVVVVLHVVLVTLWSLGIEKRLVVRFDRASTVSTAINAGLQIFISIITTAIVAIAQPLALQRQFSQRQTLTALADKSSAWSGLGSAVMTFIYNLQISASPFSIVQIGIYFAGLTVLHTTTPILFSVPITLDQHQISAATIIGTPKLYFDDPQSRLETVIPDWYGSSVGMGTFGSGLTMATPGLYENRVYDTLLSTSSTSGIAEVNYTDFVVQCGMVPNANVIASMSHVVASSYNQIVSGSVNVGRRQAVGVTGVTGVTGSSLPSLQSDHDFGPYSLGSLNISAADVTVSDSFRFHDPMHGSLPTSLLYWAPSTILIRAPGIVVANMTPLGNNILLYSVYNESAPGFSSPVRDRNGSIGSTYSIDISVDFGHPDMAKQWLQVQVFGCSVHTSNGTAVLNGTTNQLVEASQPNYTELWAGREWGVWESTGASQDPLEDCWGSMFLPASSVALWSSAGIADEWNCSASACHVPTLIEQYLTDAVFDPPSLLGDESAIVPFSSLNATLGTLESALSKATAMTMWTAARSGTFRSEGKFSGTSFQSSVLYGNTTVTSEKQAGRLQLNIIPLSIGTASSLMLLVLAVILLRPVSTVTGSTAVYGGGHAGTPVGNLGLLQVVRMLEGNPKVCERLAHVEDLDTQVLRKAAMFEVLVLGGRILDVESGPGFGRTVHGIEKSVGSMETLR